MERDLLKAMVDMQGYQVSFDKSYLASSRQNLEGMKRRLDEAHKLIEKYPHLETLKTNTAKAAEKSRWSMRGLFRKQKRPY